MDREMKQGFRLLAGFCLGILFLTGPTLSQELSDKQVSEFSRSILLGAKPGPRKALEALVKRGNPDVAATLILAMRYLQNAPAINQALSILAEQKIENWNEAMLWQEAHPEIIPHKSYANLKLQILQRIDPNFKRFLNGQHTRRNHMKIRLEEITWGGVVVDGIPSLDNPKMIAAVKADYIKDKDLVFGIEINGDARAYPLRIMGWHEMFNDTIGGIPVALAYCTLCGSGILFETLVKGRTKPLVFGSSGFLYRSNKLMFDRETDSLWNQFTGQPVSGPLVNSDIKLKIRPIIITSWKRWKASNPQTKILSLTTGFSRNYDSGNVYNAYFASPDLMFPTIVRDESVLKRKDYVFGIRDFGVAKAWPISAFQTGKVINDTIGSKNLVLIGDTATRSVRAYQRENQTFVKTDKYDQLNDGEVTWKISEDKLTAADGKTLPRVPGHIAYWFAWDGYLGNGSELYSE
jgi:hypothetical protein